MTVDQLGEELDAPRAQETYDEILQKVLVDGRMREKLSRFGIRDNADVCTTHRQAREIMRERFFGIEDAVRCFKVKPTRSHLLALAVVPFTAGELHAVRETHVLSAVFPIPMVDFPVRFTYERQLWDWLSKSHFLFDRGQVGWQLVRATPVRNSISKKWRVQQECLHEREDIPYVQLVAYAVLGHFFKTGSRLLESVYVNCVDIVETRGIRVRIGKFTSQGLQLGYSDVDAEYDDVGLAAVRKDA